MLYDRVSTGCQQPGEFSKANAYEKLRFAVTRDETANVGGCDYSQLADLLGRCVADGSETEMRRQSYCLGYFAGINSATDLLRHLVEDGFPEDDEALAEVLAAGMLAKGFSPPPEPPEPSSAAIQPPSEEIVRVTSAARERRKAEEAA